MGEVDVVELVVGARAGEPRAVARLISLVESGAPSLPEVAAALAPEAGRAHVVGVTGAPGVGKSTSTAALVRALRRRGRRVGVLAIDPSSPFSGGALLGDRVRMTEHSVDSGVYIRSMASRGQLGGLAWAAPMAVRVLDVAGCDVVVVETVGVGQSEIDVAGLADSTLVLLAPGAGDGIQAAKAGILEIGDVFAVNKADREGAESTRRELRSVLRLGERPWTPPIVMTVATEGDGIDEALDALTAHRGHLRDSGELLIRRRERARREIEALALRALRHRLERSGEGGSLDVLADDVAAGRSDPFAAADAIVRRASRDGP